MKLTVGKKTEKATEKATKKLKFNVFNIKSLLVFDKKKLDKIKKEKKKFSLFEKKKKIVKDKEDRVESPRTMGSTLKNIAGSLLAKPKSIIDKFKEFFGIILLGILVNNLPRIITELQKVLGKIKEFFDNNPWIGKTIKFAFDIIAKGMMGILDLTKALMPVIGGSFKFALDTIKTVKNEIGKLLKFFDDLGGGIGALMTSFGYKPPAKAAQAYAKSKGKYYSSTTGKTYANYKAALKNAQVKKGAQQQSTAIQQKAQKAQAAPSRGYTPNKGTTGIGTTSKGFKQMVVAPLTTGYGANRKTEYLFKDPNNLNARPVGLKANDPGLKPSIQRYNAVNQAQNVQKFSIGGTIKNFFGGMFGFGKGNAAPQQGTRGQTPSLTTKDDGKSYSGPYASPAGTAKGRKARETVNYFKLFENNIDLQNRRLKKEGNNLDLFSEFMKSYENLSKLRDKYGESYYDPSRRRPPGTQGSSDQAISVDPDEVIGVLGRTGQSTGPHIHIENASRRGGAIPENVKKNIFVNGRDMITALVGPEDGNDGIGNYSWRKSANNPTGYHAGEDFAGPAGQKITLRGGLKFVKYSPDDGSSGYGNRVLIEAPDGTQYTLNHLESGPANQRELLRRQQQQLAQSTPGGSNAEKVWNYFKSKKVDGTPMTDIAVAGIMGNAQQESGFNPTIAHSVRGNGGKFIGIFQWGNGGNGNRWGGLKKWAKENGNLDIESIDTQLKWTWSELGGSYKNVLPMLQAAKTPQEAASVWYEYYEQARHGLPERQQYAKGFYSQYKGRGGQKAAPVLSKTQQLEKNIVSTMINDLGTRSITVGDKNVSIEKKDGKDVIKVTTGGVLGIGARQLQLDENLLNNLLYEIKKKGTKVDPVEQTPGPPSTPNYGGANASTNIVFLNQETAYIVPGPTETVPVPGPTQIVPIFISQGNSSSRSLRSNIS